MGWVVEGWDDSVTHTFPPSPGSVSGAAHVLVVLVSGGFTEEDVRRAPVFRPLRNPRVRAHATVAVGLLGGGRGSKGVVGRVTGPYAVGVVRVACSEQS